ncbi:uncharacterized protein LOC128961490 [Oppia nitens]|uniref:uncharacterized protein LOC128961490 n=1 Tax=Oppia nitens TaxID=1686743 RepID=UPI0023DC7C5A|nr:uncharacterized protein LOC128961490 [Oppia nitens]
MSTYFKVTLEDHICQHFVDNSVQIDYPYVHINYTDNHYVFTQYLFIGHNYWQLMINESRNLDQFVVYFQSNYSKIFNGFKGNYSMIFSTPLEDDQHFVTGVITKLNDTIDWQILQLESNHLTTSGIKAFNSLKLIFEDNFRPSLVFYMYLNITDTLPANRYRSVCFANIHNNNSKSYRCYRFNKVDDINIKYENNTDNVIHGLKQEITNQGINFNVNLNLIAGYMRTIAIIPTVYPKFNHFRNSWDYYYLFLYSQNKQIHYCFSETNLFIKECSSNDIQLLMDCTKYEESTLTTQMEIINKTIANNPSETVDQSKLDDPNHDKHESNTWGPIINIIVAILIILVVITIAVLFVCVIRKSLNKPEKYGEIKKIHEPVANSSND